MFTIDVRVYCWAQFAMDLPLHANRQETWTLLMSEFRVDRLCAYKLRCLVFIGIIEVENFCYQCKQCNCCYWILVLTVHIDDDGRCCWRWQMRWMFGEWLNYFCLIMTWLWRSWYWTYWFLVSLLKLEMFIGIFFFSPLWFICCVLLVSISVV